MNIDSGTKFQKNRRELFKTLELQLANNLPTLGFALFLVNLDRFTKINDRFGYAVGDAVLLAVRKRLLDVIDPRSAVVRLGGDQFLIIQTNCLGNTDACEFATMICNEITRPFQIGKIKVDVSSSVGVLVDAHNAGDITKMIRCADLALREAKLMNKGHFVLFEPSMLAVAIDQEFLEKDLTQAIKENQLRLYYQPIVSADSRNIVAVEALIRWHHPERGLILPSVFIPVAERIGMISEIGIWVIYNACKDLAAVSDSIRVSLNLSAFDFQDENLETSIAWALMDSGLEASRLQLEITETVVMNISSSVKGQIDRIRQKGVTIALDDFGTGFSSLSSLFSFPVDCIKIDQSFVRDILNEHKSRVIVQGLVSIANGLGLTVVAEGVESGDEAIMLQMMGVSHLQGYYFGRPTTIEFAIPREGNSTQKIRRQAGK